MVAMVTIGGLHHHHIPRSTALKRCDQKIIMPRVGITLLPKPSTSSAMTTPMPVVTAPMKLAIIKGSRLGITSRKRTSTSDSPLARATAV